MKPFAALILALGLGLASPGLAVCVGGRCLTSAKGVRVIDDCGDLDDTGEACVWNFWHEPRACREGACSKLVVFFNGSDMGCRYAFQQPRRLGKLLRAYAEAGYFAVTACLYESFKGAGRLPLGAQVPRVDRILRAVRADPVVKQRWTGRSLLLSGVSLGASTPVVAMARTQHGTSPAWHGTNTTAACFYDGVYDVAALDGFFWEHRKSCNLLRNEVLCSRYAGEPNCEYPVGLTPATVYDSAALASVEGFGIPSWRLVECGSAIRKPKCAIDGDWVPREQIEAMCRKIDGTRGLSCDFAALEHKSHLACAFDDEGMAACRRWFDRLAEM